MQQRIENVIDGMLEQMKAYGVSESTVYQYRRGFCKRIAEYCAIKGNGYYSEKVLGEFQSIVKKQFDCGEIQKRHFNATKRTIRCLKEYAETGNADFSVQVDTRKYRPIKEHLSLIESILAETTLQEGFKYRIHVCMRYFFVYIEALGVQDNEISDDIIKAFINEVSASNAGSMEYILYSVNLISGYIRRNEIADTQTDFHCFIPKSAPIKLIAPYSMAEINCILNAVTPDCMTAKRDKAIILLALNTGFRGIDIIKLRFSDIDWKKGEVRIIQSKTKRPVTLPLNGTSLNALADYILEERPESQEDTVFLRALAPHMPFKQTSALDGMIERLCHKAGIHKKPYRSFHSLRRAFATELSSAEIPLPSISQMLGHRNIDSDVPYLSFNRRQTSICATGFEEIPLTTGVYAGLSDITYASATNKNIPLPELELYRLVAMGFGDISLERGAAI